MWTMTLQERFGVINRMGRLEVKSACIPRKANFTIINAPTPDKVFKPTVHHLKQRNRPLIHTKRIHQHAMKNRFDKLNPANTREKQPFPSS
ncbi:hypothetical protein MTR_7g023545 [Medicago truncatula]|uniref:Uncharacterized protein n=1 Tax=Medicago truncatula TaxID=3880 RepID=A0A072TWV9_MEDTR|nr:hypothetical protein MTR_7g023545 [Medicago truncatula]